jgi:hypothetical protein
MAGGSVHHPAARVQHRGEVDRSTELRRHIDRTEQQRPDRGARAADRERLLEGGIALDDHMQLDGPRRALQQRIDDAHLIRRFHLRHHDGIGRARLLDDREQILEAEGRAQAVDAHHALDATARASSNKAMERARASSLCAGITASSRSIATMSGPAASAFSNRSGRVPGTNSRLRRG